MKMLNNYGFKRCVVVVMTLLAVVMAGCDDKAPFVPVPEPEPDNARTIKGFCDTTVVDLVNFPAYMKKNFTITLDCDLEKMDKGLQVGQHVVGDKGETQWGSLLEIDATNLRLNVYTSTDKYETRKEIAHGMDLNQPFRVTVEVSGEKAVRVQSQKAKITLFTPADSASAEWDVEWDVMRGGTVFFKSLGATGGKAVLEAECSDVECDIWTFGDSYFDMSPARWVWYMREDGHFDFYLNGRSGGTSLQLCDDVIASARFGKPKYLLWCLGMNDRDLNETSINSNWLASVQKIVEYCSANDVTLILSTVPNTPSRSSVAKNKWVKESGFRYVDFAEAVGASEAGSSWTEGYLSSDKVHPTIVGAKAMYQQVLKDFPEIAEAPIEQK